MQQIFNKYINYLEAERNASHYTVRNYTTDLLGFFQFLRDKGIGSLKEVGKHTLRDYLSQLMEQGLVKASIARKLSAIRSFYRYLLREGMVPTSPIMTFLTQAGQALTLISYYRRGRATSTSVGA